MKSDYKKSMLRLGAVVVASTTMASANAAMAPASSPEPLYTAAETEGEASPEINAQYKQDGEAIEALNTKKFQVGDELDRIYSDWMDEAEFLDIWNDISEKIDGYMNALPIAYENALTTGEYVSPFSQEDLDAIETNMDDLLELVQAFADNADNRAAWQSDVDAINAALDKLSEAVGELDATDPAWEDDEKAKGMYDAINGALTGYLNEANEALENSKLTGEYNVPFDQADIDNLEAEIDELLNYIQDKTANNELRLQDAAAVQVVLDKAQEIAKQLDRIYPEWMDDEEVYAEYTRIEDTLNGYMNAINAAWQESLETGKYATPYTDAELEAADADLENLLDKVQKNVANEKLRQQDATEIQALIDEANSLYTELYVIDPAWEDDAQAKAMYDEIMDTLNGYMNAINAAWQESLETGKYATPYTDEALDAIRGNMEALRELVENQAVNPEIAEAWQNDVDAINAAMDRLTEAVGELDATDSAWEEDEKAKEMYDSISDTLLGYLNAANEAYDNSKLTGEYNVPFDQADIAAVEAQIEDLLNYVQNKVANADLRAQDAAEVQTLIDEVNFLYDELNATDPAWEDDAKAKAWYDRIMETAEGFMNAINAAWQESLETGKYATPYTDAEIAEVRADMEALLEFIQNKVNTDPAITEAYENDMAAIQPVMDRVNELASELDATDPNWMDDEKAKADFDKIQETVNGYYNLINEAYASSDKTGEYVSPIDQTDLDAVEAEIEDLLTYVQNKVANADLRQQDADEIQALLDEANELAQQLDIIYPDWMNDEDVYAEYTRIEDVLNGYMNAINAAWQTSLESGKYATPYTDAEIDEVKADMKNLLEKVQNNVANEKLRAQDAAEVQTLIDEVNFLYDELNATDPAWEDDAKAKAWYDRIMTTAEGYMNAINAAWQESLETGKYTTPYTDAEIAEVRADMEALLEFIQNKVNTDPAITEAYENDMAAIQPVMDRVNELASELDATDPNWMDDEKAKADFDKIQETVNGYYNLINEAYAASDKSGEYISPIDQADLDAVEAEIEDLLTYVQNKVANADLRQQDAAEIQALLDEANSLYAELNVIDPAWEDDAQAKAMYDEIMDTLNGYMNAVNAAWQESLETGKYATPYTDAELDAIRGNMEALRELVENQAVNPEIAEAWQNDVDTINEAMGKLREAVGELDATDPAWEDDEKAKGMYDSISDTLNGYLNEANEAYENSKLTGEYNVPFDQADIAAVEAQIEDLLNYVQNKTANADLRAQDAAEVQTLLDEVNFLYDELNATDPAWEDDAKAKAWYDRIMTTAEGFMNAINAAWQESLETGKYATPYTDAEIAEVRADMEALLEFIQNKVNTDPAITEAYENDMATIQPVMDRVNELASELDATDPNWMDDEKAKADFDKIQETVNGYYNLINEAYASSDKTGEYVSPIDQTDLDAVEAEIEDLLTYVQNKVANADLRTQDAEEIQTLIDEAQDLALQLDRIYPEWMDDEDVYAEYTRIENTINGFMNAINAAWQESLETGKYATPYTDAEISEVKADMENLLDKVQKNVANEKLRQQDAAEIQALIDEANSLYAELNVIDPAWEDDAQAKAMYDGIMDALNGYMNAINAAWQESLETGKYATPYTDAELDAVRGNMEALRELVENQAVNPEIAEAWQNDVNAINAAMDKLREAVGELDATDPAWEDDAKAKEMYDSINDILNGYLNAANEAYENSKLTGEYTVPFDQADIDNMEAEIEDLLTYVQNKVANAELRQQDAAAAEELYKKSVETGNILDGIDPFWMDIEAASALWDEIMTLVDRYQNAVNIAWQESLTTGKYVAPFTQDDLNAVETMMEDLVDLVKSTLENNRTAYNDAAYGADITLLGNLQELLSNAWNEIVAEYPSFEDFGAAIALHTNLYNDLKDMVDLCDKEYEAVETAGTYPAVIPSTFEQDILDGIDQLKYEAEQFAIVWNEWQADGKEVQDLYDEFNYAICAELDAKDPTWMEKMTPEASALFEEITSQLDELYSEMFGVWNVYLKTGEYNWPYDEQDYEALQNKMYEFKNLVLETKVGTIEFDAEAEYYTLDGQKLSRPVRGIVNVVRKGGKAEKIFIK